MARLGLVVNPIAGMGGRVGLKGTDGDATLRFAIERGAIPASSLRASVALGRLMELSGGEFELMAGPGPMGESVARELGISPAVVGRIACERTSAADTMVIAREMAELGVDLILFAGGDGTARDVYAAIGESRLALGIPAGVKIHSAAFASSPAQAGELASSRISGASGERLAEVMDIDEDAYRSGELRARLFGYLRIPYERNRVQGLKAGSGASDASAQAAIAATVVEAIRSDPGSLWLIGAGTTTRAVTDALGVRGTLLGVDAYSRGALVGTDLNERELLSTIERFSGAKINIALTPIGGQGFVFGRGNQQLSPDVVKAAGGRESVVILASPSKLGSLAGAPLLADTGDAEFDRSLAGYFRIISGRGQYVIYPLRAA